MAHLRSIALVVCVFLGATNFAERAQAFDDWTVHYSLFNSTFLEPSIATKYGLTRSERTAILNLTFLDPDKAPSSLACKGTYRNLLGQSFKLKFQQVRDGAAIYYLANVPFTDRETLRFAIEIEFPKGKRTLEFSQKLYRDQR